MKKIIIYSFLLSITFLLFACKPEEDIRFRMTYEQDFEIKAGLNTFEAHYFTIQDISSNAVSFFTTFDALESEILAINPGAAQFNSIIANDDYSFIRDISVRMFLDDPEVYKEIFYRDNVPLNASGRIDLLPTLVSLKDWVTEEKFNIHVRLTFRQTPPQFVETRLNFDFLVK